MKSEILLDTGLHYLNLGENEASCFRNVHPLSRLNHLYLPFRFVSRLLANYNTQGKWLQINDTFL